MVEMEEEQDIPGIDLNSFEQDSEEKLLGQTIDMSDYAENEGKEPGWLETAGDWLIQAGLGAAKKFTWPLDVLKLSMLGEGLSEIDELEAIHEREGIPFDRQKYLKTVLESSQFIPTQQMGEDVFKELTGLSLEPRTESGKRVRQGAEIFGLSPGSVSGKLTAGVTGALSTHLLKQAGVGEGKAEVAGDVLSMSPSLFEKGAKTLTAKASQLKTTADKHALPFLEYMVREREPILKGKLFEATENRLKDQFNVTATEALQRIVRNEMPIKNLENRGINLDVLSNFAYDRSTQLAKSRPQPLKMDEVIKNIDGEISRIKNLAPSPSDAQKEAIKILEKERDVFKVYQPNPEQIINQTRNYNSNTEKLYLKPELKAAEKEVTGAYAFLKKELVDAMGIQLGKEFATTPRVANEIFGKKMNLRRVEKILGKAFTGDIYDPKKLTRLLNSKKGDFLRRDLGSKGVRELEDIAKYGVKAEQQMKRFLDLNNSIVGNEIKSLGQLAPIILAPQSTSVKALAFGKPIARYVQGKLLTRPATREAYRLTLKSAAEGSFQLMKKDMFKLEQAISEEWGSVDNFMDDILSQLELTEEELNQIETNRQNTQ